MAKISKCKFRQGLVLVRRSSMCCATVRLPCLKWPWDQSPRGLGLLARGYSTAMKKQRSRPHSRLLLGCFCLLSREMIREPWSLRARSLSDLRRVLIEATTAWRAAAPRWTHRHRIGRLSEYSRVVASVAEIFQLTTRFHSAFYRPLVHVCIA